MDSVLRSDSFVKIIMNIYITLCASNIKRDTEVYATINKGYFMMISILRTQERTEILF